MYRPSGRYRRCWQAAVLAFLWVLRWAPGGPSEAAWRSGCADGTLTEVFACGTAAVITPVGAVKSAKGSWTVADGGPGEVTMRLRQALVDIQRGVAPDPHGWMHRHAPHIV
jgi:branched-chain amino acid aminotransferase